MERSDRCFQFPDNNNKCIVCLKEVLYQVPFSDGTCVLPSKTCFFNPITRYISTLKFLPFLSLLHHDILWQTKILILLQMKQWRALSMHHQTLRKVLKPFLLLSGFCFSCHLSLFMYQPIEMFVFSSLFDGFVTASL